MGTVVIKVSERKTIVIPDLCVACAELAPPSAVSLTASAENQGLRFSMQFPLCPGCIAARERLPGCAIPFRARAKLSAADRRRLTLMDRAVKLKFDKGSLFEPLVKTVRLTFANETFSRAFSGLNSLPEQK